jgi:hypothetical protein
MSPDAAELLSEVVVSSIRAKRIFAQVVSVSEIRDTLSFEQQRQMLQCDARSCLAEMAGALGVDYVVSGSVGRLGSALVFSLKLVDVKTGVGESAVSRVLEGATDEVAARHVDQMVSELLASSALVPPTASQAPHTAVPGEKPSAAGPSTETQGKHQRAPHPPSSPSMLSRVLLWGGAGAAALGSVLALGAVILAGASAGVVTGLFAYFAFALGTAAQRERLEVAYDVAQVLAVLGVALIPLPMVLVLAGAAAAAASFVL